MNAHGRRFLEIHPPLWFLVLLLTGLGVHALSPPYTLVHVPYTILAGTCFVAGLILVLWAVALLRKENTEILPTSETNTTLVVYGPYRISRNPMYLGLMSMFIAIAFFVGTIPLFLAAFLLYSILDRVFIPYEEEKMERIFGQPYRDYMTRVRRWI